MSQKERTTREALIAEMLGDLDTLLARVEALPGVVGQVEADTVKSQRVILGEFIDASNRFQRITTQSVDDFVGVANEALSKFVQRTNEIKATLDALKAAAPEQRAPARPEPAPVQEQATNTALYWLLPVVFFVGCGVGALAALLLK